jgi:hypothetical protein
MKTSNFKIAGKHPNTIAICRGRPVWFHKRWYEPLAPTREMLAIKDEAEFSRQYAEILAGLDARQVVADLGDNAILLCWEAVGQPCHRRTVAGWIERETGIAVPEYQLADDLQVEMSVNLEREPR